MQLASEYIASTATMDLNLLSALDLLLQETNVTRAAQRMQLSAPAMSRTLSRLRIALGDPVLVRAGRSLVPTPRAISLREPVRAAVLEARRLLAPASPVDPRAFRRSLTLRVDDAATATLGPVLLERVAAKAPGLTLVFLAEGTEDVAALRDGPVDVDFGVQGSLGPEVRVRSLFTDSLAVLGRRGHPLLRKQGKALSLRAFASAEHIVTSRRGRQRGPVDEALEARGLSRQVRAVVPNQLSAALLAVQTDALALVSRRFAEEIQRTLKLDHAPPPMSLSTQTVALAWHPRFDADPAHAWLRQEIYDACQPLRSQA
jgi:DNA-binding transcriptional LysR family regulator